MTMETCTMTPAAPWVSLNPSSRSVYESPYLTQSHQRHQNGLNMANSMAPSENGDSPPDPRFANDDLDSIPQKSCPPVIQDDSTVVRDKVDLDSIPQKSCSPVKQDEISGIEDKGHQIFDQERFLNYDFDFKARRTWTEQKEKVVTGPYDYIASEPGKEFRTQFLNAINAWLEVPPESLTIIANVVRILHTASLLIDDIQDNSVLRRGRPVAHKIYGVAQTINSANYAYFLALQELQKLSNPAAAFEVYTSEMLHLHQGQGMDLFWRDTLTCPTEDDYMEMVSNKTGGLFRLAVRLMQLESPTSFDCMPMTQLLGLAFQIADDHKNLSDFDYTQKKGTCDDLTEGKFSFPVIHSIHSDPLNLLLLHILEKKPTDINVKLSAVQYMESTGSREYTKQVVSCLIRRAKKEADAIDQGCGRSERMHMLIDKLAVK